MFRNLITSAIRRAAWSAKKKTIKQILQSRCRRDGIPEYGRFTPREIEQIIHQANLNIKELMPHFVDHDNIGNYLMEYGGLLDLAIYRVLINEMVDTDYAMGLIGDMIWQARVNAKGLIPIIDPLRMKIAKLTTQNPMGYLEKRLRDGMKYPYSKPGYKIEFYRDKAEYLVEGGKYQREYTLSDGDEVCDMRWFIERDVA